MAGGGGRLDRLLAYRRDRSRFHGRHRTLCCCACSACPARRLGQRIAGSALRYVVVPAILPCGPTNLELASAVSRSVLRSDRSSDELLRATQRAIIDRDLLDTG